MNIPKTTHAAVLYELKKPLVIEELELPELQAGQVLVKIAYSGVCHTQLLEVNGSRGADPYLPHLLGHEASGTVLAVGEGVNTVKPQDSVVLSWIKGAGCNSAAPIYTAARAIALDRVVHVTTPRHWTAPQAPLGFGGTLNKTTDGKKINAGQIATFAEHAIVSENRCTTIPNNIPLDIAALLGCAIPTGAGIVINQLGVRPGESLVIIGVGGVGLCAVLAASFLHCNPIIAIDINEKNLELAKTLGATYVFNPKNCDASKEVKGILKNGADYIIDASGNANAMEMGFKLTRESGGQFVIAGNLPFGETIRIDPFDLIKGKKIIGSWGGQTSPTKQIPVFAELFMKRIWPLERLIAQTFKFHDVNIALDTLETGVSGRILLQI